MAKHNDQPMNSSKSPSNSQLIRYNKHNRQINNIEKPAIPAEEEDPNCPVCLNRVQERAYTNSCLHEFCFPCIQEWSRNHNRCPVCREFYANILYNIRSSTEYDELPVEEPINEMNGVLLRVGQMRLFMTPLDSGYYLVNPRIRRHGMSYDMLFLGPNQRFILNNMNPNMIIVRTEQLDVVLTQMNQMGYSRYHPHYGRHPHFRHSRHIQQNQENGQNYQKQNPDPNSDYI
jgi:hypothetical protein